MKPEKVSGPLSVVSGKQLTTDNCQLPTAKSTPFFHTDEAIKMLRLAAAGWIGTPFYPNGRSKGVQGGVSCQMLVAEIYQECGFFPPDYLPPDADMGWSNANKDSLIEKAVAQAGDAFALCVGEPHPGDMLGFRIGGCVHHLGICLGSEFIHAMAGREAQLSLVHDATYLQRMERIWRPMK